MKAEIVTGDIEPFYGEIYSQDGVKRNSYDEAMNPRDIMEMEWLVENVVGNIPNRNEFVDGAHGIIELKGVDETK